MTSVTQDLCRFSTIYAQAMPSSTLLYLKNKQQQNQIIYMHDYCSTLMMIMMIMMMILRK